jgi:hypothetical protein
MFWKTKKPQKSQLRNKDGVFVCFISQRLTAIFLEQIPGSFGEKTFTHEDGIVKTRKCFVFQNTEALSYGQDIEPIIEKGDYLLFPEY